MLSVITLAQSKFLHTRWLLNSALGISNSLRRRVASVEELDENLATWSAVFDLLSAEEGKL